MGLYLSLYCTRCLFLYSSQGTQLSLSLSYLLLCTLLPLYLSLLSSLSISSLSLYSSKRKGRLISHFNIHLSFLFPLFTHSLLLLCYCPLHQCSLRSALGKLGCAHVWEEWTGKKIWGAEVDDVGAWAVSTAGSRAAVSKPWQYACLSKYSGATQRRRMRRVCIDVL